MMIKRYWKCKGQYVAIILLGMLVVACNNAPVVAPQPQVTISPSVEVSLFTGTTAILQDDPPLLSTSTAITSFTVQTTTSTVITESVIKPFPRGIITETQVLTGHDSVRLAWSPNSLKLAYVNRANVTTLDTNDQIWLFDLTTSEHVYLLDNGQWVAWNPDGQKLGITSHNSDLGGYDITIYDFATQQLEPLGFVTNQMVINWLTEEELLFWDDTTLKVVNILTREIVAQIEVHPPHGRHLTDISTIPRMIATYNPETKLIIFQLQVDQKQSKVTENFITERKFEEISLSPSGQILAYVTPRSFPTSKTAGSPAIFGLLNLVTGEEQVLLQSGDYGLKEPWIRYPIWSPDERFIALTIARVKGSQPPIDIYLFDVETGEMNQQPLIKDIIGSPTWSPDGKYLAFLREDSSKEVRHTTAISIVALK